MFISTQDWKNYIDKLSMLNKEAADKMVKYIQTYGFGDREAIIRYANALVLQYGNASGSLAASMYDAIAEMSGKFYEPADPAEPPKYGEVAKTVNGAIKQSENPNVLGSAVGRLVKQQSADTMLQNAARDTRKYGKKKNTGIQFAWVPMGDTCPFCLVLASRGWQNQTVGGETHAEHIHANCDCNYAVRFDTRSGIEGYDPDKYLQMYENAEGDTPREKINFMRRTQYQQEKEESRKREKKLINNTRINKEAYSEKELRKFTDSLNETTNIRREIYKNAKNILEHRDGTLYEDLAFVDVIKEKSKINKDFDLYDEITKTSACKPSKPMIEMLQDAAPETIIGLHNHPSSYAPSDSDISRAYERRYKYGLVFCHNGTKYKYHVHKEYDALKVHFNLDNLEKAVYDGNVEKINKYINDLKESGVDMEVFL